MKKVTVFNLLSERGVSYDTVIRTKGKIDIYIYERIVRAVHDKEQDFISIYNNPRSVLHNIKAKLAGTF